MLRRSKARKPMFPETSETPVGRMIVSPMFPSSSNLIGSLNVLYSLKEHSRARALLLKKTIILDFWPKSAYNCKIWTAIL